MTIDDETDDHVFLGSRLSLRQFRNGHRVGTDAILLAAALDLEHGECVVDVGAGVGAAGLAMLDREPGATAVLLERDMASCALARHNIRANRMEPRARVVEADLFDVEHLRDAGLRGRADLVISNPPFYEADRTRPSSSSRRRAAHMLDQGGHGAWLRATAWLAGPRARMAIVHRPEALASLLPALPGGWGDIRIRPIYTRPNRAATRMLFCASNGSRAPLAILPPLHLHDADGRFTAEADALHRGVAPGALGERPV